MSLIFNPLLDLEYFIYLLIKSIIFTRSTLHAFLVSATFWSRTLVSMKVEISGLSRQGWGAVGSFGRRRWEKRSASSDQVTAALRDLRSSRPIPGLGKVKHKLTCASTRGDWGVEGEAPARNRGIGRKPRGPDDHLLKAPQPAHAHLPAPLPNFSPLPCERAPHSTALAPSSQALFASSGTPLPFHSWGCH